MRVGDFSLGRRSPQRAFTPCKKTIIMRVTRVYIGYLKRKHRDFFVIALWKSLQEISPLNNWHSISSNRTVYGSFSQWLIDNAVFPRRPSWRNRIFDVFETVLGFICTYMTDLSGRNIWKKTVLTHSIPLMLRSIFEQWITPIVRRGSLKAKSRPHSSTTSLKIIKRQF